MQTTRMFILHQRLHIVALYIHQRLPQGNPGRRRMIQHARHCFTFHISKGYINYLRKNLALLVANLARWSATVFVLSSRSKAKISISYQIISLVHNTLQIEVLTGSILHHQHWRIDFLHLIPSFNNLQDLAE